MIRTMAAVGLAVLTATSWGESEWAKKFTITYSGYQGTSVLMDFPVLVRINPATISGFSYSDFQTVGEDGRPIDLLFADEAGIVLNHEIDTWDASGESLVWVKVPSFAAATKIVVYYGKANATAGAAGSSVWQNDYVAVWHMNGNGTEAVPDATGHAFPATPYGLSSSANGRVGSALYGSSEASATQGLRVPNYKSVLPGTTFTVSGWFKHNNANGNYAAGRRLFSRKAKYDSGTGWEVILNDVNADTLHVRGASKDKTYKFAGQGALNQNDWFHVSVTYDGSEAPTAYANGRRLTAASGSNMSAPTGLEDALGIGNYSSGTGGKGSFAGWMDEARLRTGVISDDWAAAEYATVAQADFAVYSAAGAADEEVVVLPQVAATAAGDITALTATLNGTVVTMGNATSLTLKFLWGRSAEDMTNEVAIADAVTEAGNVSAPLTGLLPGTTYCYQLCATDGEVSVASKTLSFATADGAPVLSSPTVIVGTENVTMSVELIEPAVGVTTVKLWFSEDGENYDCISTWSDITETNSFSFVTNGLAQVTQYHYYFSAEGVFSAESGETVETSTSGTPAYLISGGLITWQGTVDTSWRNGENWGLPADFMPNGFGYDIRIDGDDETNVVVALTGNTTLNRWQLNSITVDAGDELRISKSGGNVSVSVTNLVNNGSVYIHPAYSGNEQTLTVSFANRGTPLTGTTNASLRCVNDASNANRNRMRLNLHGDFINEGEILVSQFAHDRCNNVLTIKNAGTIVNNGEIRIKSFGNRVDTTGFAFMRFDSQVNRTTNVLAGTGRLVLDMEERTNGGTGSTRIDAGEIKTQTLLNGPSHTLMGTGLITGIGLLNEGLVLGTGSVGRLSIEPALAKKDNGYGKPLCNASTGRLVAANPGGVYLGNASDPSTVLNEGLMEARTGSFVEIREKATASLTQWVAANLVLGGTLVGGGSFRAYRPLVIPEGGVVSPGDRAPNAAGVPDGLGESTAGTLTLAATNVTFSAGSTLQLQLLGAAQYDTLLCEGDLTLKGVVDLTKATSGVYAGVIKAKGTLDWSDLTFRKPAGVARPQVTVSTFEYEAEETYEVEEEVEVPVEGGEEGETTTELQTVTHTRTVTRTGNCLDLAIVQGMLIFIQ